MPEESIHPLGETKSGHGLARRAWEAIYRWTVANTFTPRQAGFWRYRRTIYLAAALLQLGTVGVVTAIVQVFPTFRFPEALLILMVVLIALAWGAASGIVATVVGVLLLDILVLPPYFSLALPREEDVVGAGLFFVVGLICSVVAGQSERRRREMQELAQALSTERVRLAQAEQTATTRANELQAIFDAITDAIYVHAADGSMLQMNEAARGLAALDTQPAVPAEMTAELGGPGLQASAPDQTLSREQRPVQRVLRGESLTDERMVDLTIRTPAGEDREVSISGAPVRDAGGRIVRAVTVVRDVTEQRHLERRTHEALDALLAMARAIVYPVYPPDGVYAPEGGAREDVRRERMADVVGQRLVELTRDVLDCRRVGITVVDPHTGLQHPLAVAGLSPEQERAWRASVEGTPIADPQTQSDDEAISGLTARFLAGEVLVLDMSEPPLRDQPNPFGIRTFLIAPLRAGQDIIGLLSLDHAGAEHTFTPDEVALTGAVAQLATLVLERERLLAERADARAAELALRETNRRMDEFLSIASHELRSPLTSIRGNLQLTRRRLERIVDQEGPTDADLVTALEPIQRMVARTEEQTGRLNRMMTDLLDVSRIQSGHLELHTEPHDLTAIVRECVETERAAWPARAITLDVPDGAVPVRADADRLVQVITNYVTNALKYSAPEQAVAVSLGVEGTEARVGVRDRGPGLTAEQQKTIWDRYRRVQGVAVQDAAAGSGGGLGLGLYISRTIVEQHGGRVGVESKPGEGSTFWFTLPVAQSTPDDGQSPYSTGA